MQTNITDKDAQNTPIPAPALPPRTPQLEPDTNPPGTPATPTTARETPGSNSVPPAPAPTDEPPKTNSDHRRNGKVARLPKTLREIVNVMLSDGTSYSVIIQKLAKKGHHLNKDNLSRWHSGGYLDWQKEQLWLEEARGRLEFASEILQQDNADLLGEATLRIALTRMHTLLLSFDPVVLKHSISNNPGTYPRLLNALCKMTEGTLKLHRHRTGESSHKPSDAPLRRALQYRPAPHNPSTDSTQQEDPNIANSR